MAITHTEAESFGIVEGTSPYINHVPRRRAPMQQIEEQRGASADMQSPPAEEARTLGKDAIVAANTDPYGFSVVDLWRKAGEI